MADRLSNYPYVLVRIGCTLCGRRGQYRLARLAAKFGPETSLEDLLDQFALSCPYPRPGSLPKRRKYQAVCGIELVDIGRPSPRPPDLPRRGLVAIPGGKADLPAKLDKKAAGGG